MSRTKVQDIAVALEITLNCREASEVVGGGVAVGFRVPAYQYGNSYGSSYGGSYGTYGYDDCYTPSLYFDYSNINRGGSGDHDHGYDSHRSHHSHGYRGHGRGRRW